MLLPKTPFGGIGRALGAAPLPKTTSYAALLAAEALLNPRRPYRPPRAAEPQQRQLSAIAGVGAVTAKADKMELHVLDEDMDEGMEDEARWLRVQSNPPELVEVVKATWTKLSIQGLSHQREFFLLTESVPLKFELRFDALTYCEEARGAGGLEAAVKRVNLAERFLRSLAFPTAVTGAPPRFLLYYPKFISLTCKLDELSFKFERNAPNGQNLRFTAAMGVGEIRDVRLTRAEVFSKGNLRSASLGDVVW